MSASEPQSSSSNKSSQGIIIRGVIVAVLLGGGGWYWYSIANRPPLRKVLADGEMALSRSDIPEAERIAKVALGRAPRAPETKVYVAQVHVAKREYEEALKLLKEVPAGNQDTPSARAIQGVVEMSHSGNLEEAERLFKEALEQDPDFQYALSNYSNLLRLAVRTQDRNQIDLRRLQLHSATPAILFQLAMNWGMHTSIQQAEFLYEKNPQDTNVLLAMGDELISVVRRG